MVTENIMERVAQALSFEISLPEIRDALLKDGLSEYEIFLAVRAGELILRNQESLT